MKIENYKTSHQLARELLAGDDVICIIAVPAFDMPGCSTALPVAAEKIEVQGIACIKISVAAMPNVES
jgi:hypothetical protein